MADLAYLVLVVAFFALMLGYVRGIEALGRAGNPAAEEPHL